MENAPLDQIYTADEAAERLRLTNRGVIKLAKKYGHCSRRGRDYLFSEADLLAIWQAMREPIKQTHKPSLIAAPSLRSTSEFLEMMSGPRTSLDGRVMGVLQWLATQREPKTHKQIERAGPKTIELLIGKGFVLACGEDADGLVRVKISPAGRDLVKRVAQWKVKHDAWKARTGRR